VKIAYQASIPILAALICMELSGCRRWHVDEVPVVQITQVPPASEGSPDRLETIGGSVTGALPGQKIVLFARGGSWWVQPFSQRPYTDIDARSHWTSPTHPGTEYAALLVDQRYRPPLKTNVLPSKGGLVLAVTRVAGSKRPTSAKKLQFSGYQWELRETPGDPGGTRNSYDPANGWTDESGFLHLRIARRGMAWVSAEVKLAWSLGYGTYDFVVRDVSHFEPAVVLTLGPPQEMDIQISRWGESDDRNVQNVQYVVQPYLVPANTVRFAAPPGRVRYRMIWEPGRLNFRTDSVGSHIFTSGVPSPGNERVHINFYVFDNKRHPLQHDSEVIVEKFEFRP